MKYNLESTQAAIGYALKAAYVEQNPATAANAFENAASEDELAITHLRKTAGDFGNLNDAFKG